MAGETETAHSADSRTGFYNNAASGGLLSCVVFIMRLRNSNSAKSTRK